MNQPIVRLWGMEKIGLIIEHKTGVVYSNQTGGYVCSQPKAEGAFVPIEDPENEIQMKLRKYFTGPKWNDWCSAGIDEETADFIDSLLVSLYFLPNLKVDRNRMSQSHEAWIYVNLLPKNEDSEYQVYYGFSGEFGILTWENSD
ncbi:DUF6210 family protein [Leptospira borgpetersenii]|uniref:Uncharacterized protein n=2 Tax=Leptospira borgpetersenii serovar Hardjo-bovis TaxID=338217 RepID=Q04TE7_LEPBJ|nr:DUF6210 family protein [Leptospira borgpetersenii]ABJ75823.1 Hypothetical protein LBJ_1221 [Leptospira borgpetersenii serovar Hardjo-bovis str. JB197]ABJ78770.1 Hypothetical protein LBL_1272 [Leptospira borgpetersenii serovar Hardjo-bovis str. L550]AMX58038.1 hypothetical protein LBK6_06685 [Leptospira borgpetersenii serovar Hardjo]AMX61290.1 hypothetical protein LBK9_06710 [Leptospira borgpetersenii serovar Hardjo]AMX64535.1 hypothetical protein LBK30_06765 [Leptospira borgpetersenii serov